jgi:hypothetical protein
MLGGEELVSGYGIERWVAMKHLVFDFQARG